MWYIFDKNGNCMSTADCEPDANDLASREETATQSDENIAIDKAGRDDSGKIIAKAEQELTAVESKSQKIAALDAKYQLQFRELQLAWAAASISGGDTPLTEDIKSDYMALKAEYQTELEAINSGS